MNMEFFEQWVHQSCGRVENEVINMIMVGDEYRWEEDEMMRWTSPVHPEADRISKIV
jgi:hypothetical protein